MKGEVIMKRFNIVFLSLLFLATAAFLFNCENKYPSSLWDPDAATKPQPVIQQVIPADSAYAGISEIIIKGQNFSPVPEYNLVFFSGNKALVIAATETQLTIRAPKITGSDLELKIAVHEAELFSDPVNYKLLPAVSITGNLAENEEMGYAIAVDNDGNVYVSIDGKKIKKIDAQGTTTLLADVSFLKANGMKMGPDNVLYVTFAAGRLRKVATISMDGTEQDYASLPAAPEDLDFDANGNIWVTSLQDVYLVKTDQSVTKIKTFPLTLKSIRVFNGNVYVSGFDQTSGEAKIYRAPIQDETLGDEEVVFDIAAADWLSGVTVNSFTFSADGKIFLATGKSPDAIFIYNPDTGTHENLYPELVGPNIYAFTWSNDNFIYAVQQLTGASNVLKIKMFENGAPYYGRQ